MKTAEESTFLSSGKELIWVAFVGQMVCCWIKRVENFQTKKTTGAYCAPALVIIKTSEQ